MTGNAIQPLPLKKWVLSLIALLDGCSVFLLSRFGEGAIVRDGHAVFMYYHANAQVAVVLSVHGLQGHCRCVECLCHVSPVAPPELRRLSVFLDSTSECL